MARIEFCGGLGVGKSTYASALAKRWSVPLVSEQYENIPYWHLFNVDQTNCAFEKHLSFLLMYAHELGRAASTACVCDFAMFQTVAYSSAAGDPADTEAVDAVFGRITARHGHPTLVIRLHCARDVQISRIRERGRTPELSITTDYLERLDAAINRQIEKLPAHVARVNIDTSSLPTSAFLENSILVDSVSDWLERSRRGLISIG